MMSQLLLEYLENTEEQSPSPYHLDLSLELTHLRLQHGNLLVQLPLPLLHGSNIAGCDIRTLLLLLSSLPLPFSALDYGIYVVLLLLLTITRIVYSLVNGAGLEEDFPELLIREADLRIAVRC
jgi:hypothetical protein